MEQQVIATIMTVDQVTFKEREHFLPYPTRIVFQKMPN